VWSDCAHIPLKEGDAALLHRFRVRHELEIEGMVVET
jgi:hypothetical protein